MDVKDCHNNDRKIECCYSRPKRHRRVRKELQTGKKKRNPSIITRECLHTMKKFTVLKLLQFVQSNTTYLKSILSLYSFTIFNFVDTVFLKLSVFEVLVCVGVY